MNPYQPMPPEDPNRPTDASGPIPLPRAPTWPEAPLGWAPADPFPTPPPWSQQTAPPPQPPYSPGPPKRGGNTAVIVAVVVVVLLAVGGAGWFVWDRYSSKGTDPAAATHNSAPAGSASPAHASGKALAPGARPAPQSAPSSASSPPPAPATPDAEQQAVSQLQAIRDESLALVPLDGRWVAQLSSKSVGITDPLQTAANGTHTFYATDILAEVQNVQATVGSSANLYLLWGTDFGKRSTAADGSPYWTTLADAGFASEDDVTAWCAATFPGLTADQLADECAPRQLNPPHD